ncbi:hydroxypyruvate isomerase [Mesorhizobium sp. M1E.F.Ca.ET.045.02.1.1]|uniref:2-oxo-tetronate isomerase n=1 Tax=Mesorhizobium sp. M1E.F.Ca.ET.045.02.1.1 TaxID=2493672 RepID=UPI000F751AFE|nr:2-oxo-tetronate isomerase [Mesorhizobium sp. M1E.F.Ca.ET.045.02.1.1]AZO19805.1 hydroxypyruvate isomerase [Mesorhizobium sp. M1E.F.Ca.ET.045.02.1.1]
MPRFAANLTMMFNEVGFMDRFAAAAGAGFDAVEYLFPCAFDAHRIADALRRNGVTQALFNLPPGNWGAGERGLAALPDRQDDFRASVWTALAYASATGVGRVHVMSGLADRADPVAHKTYRASLAYLCDAAGARGLDVLIEPINPRDMPGYFLNDFNQAADLIAEMGLPNLKLQFDIYHRQIIHGDVLTGLRELMPIIGHVQIAAVPLRNEPGTGELDDARILRELDALKYDGFVGLEYRPAGETVAGLGWLTAYAKARRDETDSGDAL